VFGFAPLGRSGILCVLVAGMLVAEAGLDALNVCFDAGLAVDEPRRLRDATKANRTRGCPPTRSNGRPSRLAGHANRTTRVIPGRASGEPGIQRCLSANLIIQIHPVGIHLMLESPADEIIGHADVEGPVSAAGHTVDVIRYVCSAILDSGFALRAPRNDQVGLSGAPVE
jgi:hypothetical protein